MKRYRVVFEGESTTPGHNLYWVGVEGEDPAGLITATSLVADFLYRNLNRRDFATPIRVLDAWLATRTRNLLRSEGITTVEQLQNIVDDPENSLYHIKGLGLKSSDEIKDALRRWKEDQ